MGEGFVRGRAGGAAVGEDQGHEVYGGRFAGGDEAAGQGVGPAVAVEQSGSFGFAGLEFGQSCQQGEEADGFEHHAADGDPHVNG